MSSGLSLKGEGITVTEEVSGANVDLGVGTTTVTGGADTRVLYDNAGVLGEMTTTGSGTVLALATSPTLVTPTLGAATATSINSLILQAVTGGKVPVILGASATPFANGSGDTNENILGTVTIPANAMGTGGLLLYIFGFSYTNSGNNKTLRVRFGGIGGTIYNTATATTTASVLGIGMIGNAGAANSQRGNANGIGSIANTSSGTITSAIDTTSATTLVFTGQKASGAETITLERYLCLLLPAT
jgi:hypothetical protein